MMDRRSFLAAGAAALPTVSGWAQAYPDHAVRVIVPWPPGGNADVTIRPVLNRMAQLLGQPVVVENRAGATGNVGTALAARATPDGYTLLQLSSSTVLNTALTPEKSYDLQRDFEPIGLVAATPMVLEVHPSVPAKTLSELIAYAKANPGKLSYASGGVGTTAHLLTELLKLRAGLDITHIPYQGGAPAVADLMGGHVNLYFDVLPTAIPASRDGRVRVLGIAAAKRSPKLPDVPTFAEAGLADMVASVWVALLAPRGTPAAIVARLNDATHRALADATVRQQLDTIGAEPTPGTPEQLSALIRSEDEKWGEVVRRARIKAQ
jgi:tripartite-type tricarboxylate transporter receptor subunit TctC